MLRWFLFALAAGAWIALFWKHFGAPLARRFTRASIRGLDEVCERLQEGIELLAAGLAMTPERLSRLRALPAPWGELIGDAVEELRSSGASLLPSLHRFKELALEQRRVLTLARAQSSQALLQAVLSLFLIPILGVALYALMPGLVLHTSQWVLTGALCLALSATGAAFTAALAERARYGGLRPECRGWILASQLGGERFLAWVRAGLPPDLAWAGTMAWLQQREAALSEAWGASIWEEPTLGGPEPTKAQGVVFLKAGQSIKRAVQSSTLEGRSCVERVETALLALRQDFSAQLQTELQKLPVRALTPLFVCVAPSVLAQLAVGVILGAGEWM